MRFFQDLPARAWYNFSVMIDGGLLQEEKEFNRFYRFSLWWVKHKILLRRIGYGLFIFVDAAMFFFVAWIFLDSFALSYNAEERAIYEIVALGQDDLHGYTLARAAGDLEIGQARVISIGSGRYDLFSIMKNPNGNWWARFTYHFQYSGGESEEREGFLIPWQEKPIVELAIELDRPPESAELIISGIKWQRVDSKIVSDVADWMDDRLNILITDKLFETIASSNNQNIGRVTFDVFNDTAFSYYDFSFLVLLKRGSSIGGINKTVLGELKSGEQVEVSLNWFGVLPSVSEIEVVPDINIFDMDVYQPLSGESTLDTRTRVFGRGR